MSQLETARVLDLLSSLVDKSLAVYEEDEQGQGRYRLLETVRQYGQDRLVESGEAQAVRRHHRHWYAALAEDAEPPHTGAQQAEWYDRVEAEHDNVRAALTGLSEQEGEPDKALRLAAGLQPFWQTRGYWTEGRQCLREALERQADAPPAARAGALRAAGNLALCQRDDAKSRAYFEESLRLWTELEDTRNIAGALLDLTGVFWNTGVYEEIRTLAERSLALFREMNDTPGIARALDRLGVVALTRNEHTAARVFYEESLALYQEAEDKAGAARMLTLLGLEALNRGDYGAAQQRCEQSLILRREVGDKSSLANSLDYLGSLAETQGQYEQAMSLYTESLLHKRELGDRSGIAWVLCQLGRVATSHREYGLASTFLEECLQVNRDLGNGGGIADALNALGSLAYEQGLLSDAEACHEQSRAIAHGLGDLHRIANALFGLEQEAFSRRDYDRAFQCMSACLRLLLPADDKVQVAYALERVGRLARLRGQSLRAVRLWAAAAKLRQILTTPLQPGERERFDEELTLTRASLSGEPFDAAWAEGKAMTWEQAVAYALAGEEADEPD